MFVVFPNFELCIVGWDGVLRGVLSKVEVVSTVGMSLKMELVNRVCGPVRVLGLVMLIWISFVVGGAASVSRSSPRRKLR